MIDNEHVSVSGRFHGGVVLYTYRHIGGTQIREFEVAILCIRDWSSYSYERGCGCVMARACGAGVSRCVGVNGSAARGVFVVCVERRREREIFRPWSAYWHDARSRWCGVRPWHACTHLYNQATAAAAAASSCWGSAWNSDGGDWN